MDIDHEAIMTSHTSGKEDPAPAAVWPMTLATSNSPPAFHFGRCSCTIHPEVQPAVAWP